jgi:selenocysteine lyase/cysteine desulfurase
METDWRALRGEFPALARFAYLNSAPFGQVPRRAVEAMSAHLARRDELACTDFMSWFDDADRVRALVGRLIGCSAADVAFIPNASVGLSLLLGGLDWRAGDRIVTLRDEFPNQYYYPAHLRRLGVEFVETEWERFWDAVTPRTRVVALSMWSYSTGFAPPLEEIGPELARRGVLFFVDGTQGVGAHAFDVRRVQPAMLAVHAYKWLLSPNGAGFMYVGEELRARLEPSVIGWRSHKDWRNHENLHHGAPEFRTEAEKYEGGMLTFAVLYALGAVLEMLLELGMPVVEGRVRQVTEQTREVLRGAGARLLSDELPHHDSAIIAARFDGVDASAMARALKERHVLVSARHGNLRVSPHFYNDASDLARFAAALASCL